MKQHLFSRDTCATAVLYDYIPFKIPFWQFPKLNVKNITKLFLKLFWNSIADRPWTVISGPWTVDRYQWTFMYNHNLSLSAISQILLRQISKLPERECFYQRRELSRWVYPKGRSWCMLFLVRNSVTTVLHRCVIFASKAKINVTHEQYFRIIYKSSHFKSSRQVSYFSTG